jgi:hypothetical protein
MPKLPPVGVPHKTEIHKGEAETMVPSVVLFDTLRSGYHASLLKALPFKFLNLLVVNRDMIQRYYEKILLRTNKKFGWHVILDRAV